MMVKESRLTVRRQGVAAELGKGVDLKADLNGIPGPSWPDDVRRMEASRHNLGAAAVSAWPRRRQRWQTARALVRETRPCPIA